MDDDVGAPQRRARLHPHLRRGRTAALRGFWSLTLYNEHHFFHPNPLDQYSLGTKNQNLTTATDGSLTIHVSTDPPTNPGRVLNSSKAEDVDHHRPVVTEAVRVYSGWASPCRTKTLRHACRGDVFLLDVKDQ